MFREKDQHRQTFMFSSINSLPKKLLERLEASWAGTFYREIFVRIDEKVFAILTPLKEHQIAQRQKKSPGNSSLSFFLSPAGMGNRRGGRRGDV